MCIVMFSLCLCIDEGERAVVACDGMFDCSNRFNSLMYTWMNAHTVSGLLKTAARAAVS